MAQEIERKFLVTGNFKEKSQKVTKIIQGYLSSNPLRTVRIRITDNSAYLTIKGQSNELGTNRYEWEKEISTDDATELIQLAEPYIIEKNRYYVKEDKHVWEVDEFLGVNSGLVIAEIELSDENESFDKPDWLGEEVTGNTRYYNSMLSLNPFIQW